MKLCNLIVILFGWCVLGALTPPAAAATVTYNFTADVNGVVPRVYDIQGRTQSALDFQLINTATGLASIPGVTLNVGDSLNFSIGLNGPVTVPQSLGSTVLNTIVGFYSTPNTSVSYNVAYSFSLNGQPISPPLGYDLLDRGGSGGGLGYVIAAQSPVPSFTFDRFSVNSTITSASSVQNPQLSSVTLNPYNPFLVITTVVAPVPEPSSGVLLLTGAAALAVARRLRRQP